MHTSTKNLLPLTSIRSNVFSDMHALHDYVIINSLNYIVNRREGVSSGKREWSEHDKTAAVFGNSVAHVAPLTHCDKGGELQGHCPGQSG